MEYTRYSGSPTGFLQRESAEHEWVNVTAENLQLAVGMMYDADRAARRAPRPMGIQITRSERNERIAAELGINADQMADRLAKPDQNQGTATRVSEEHFDELMGEISLDPQEARDRFSGKHWQPS